MSDIKKSAKLRQEYIRRIQWQINPSPKAAATALNSLIALLPDLAPSAQSRLISALEQCAKKLSETQIQRLFERGDKQTQYFMLEKAAFYQKLSTEVLIAACRKLDLVQAIILTLARKHQSLNSGDEYSYQNIALLKAEDACQVVAEKLKACQSLPLDVFFEIAKMSPRHARLILNDTELAREIYPLWQKVCQHYHQDTSTHQKIRDAYAKKWQQRLQTVKHTQAELTMSQKAIQALLDENLQEFKAVNKAQYVNPHDIQYTSTYSLSWMAPLVRGTGYLLGTPIGVTALNAIGVQVGGPSPILSAAWFSSCQAVANYLDQHSFETTVKPKL